MHNSMNCVVPESSDGVRLGAGPERRDADPVIAHRTGGGVGGVLRNCAHPLLYSITTRDQENLP